MSHIVTNLPTITIILVIEHIAIAKSFGRIFSYTVVPSQEIMAQGFANLFSPFVGGYVCTGSFGASAVLSKAGVRTPLAGLFSALMLILALYALTAVFFYIPNAALAALIIHATCNLLTPPSSLYKYWQLSPCDLVIWVAGLLLAIFTSLEMCIYVTVGMSMALLLIRIARSKGSFMGRVRTYLATEQQLAASSPVAPFSDSVHVPQEQSLCALRDRYLPLDRSDGHNPALALESPYEGVFVYRFKEPLNYINQAYQVDTIASYIKTWTTPGASEGDTAKAHERLWCDAGPRESKNSSDDSSRPSQIRPLLAAIVLDCASINNLDVTSIQGLVDLRLALDRHAGNQPIEWHFANLGNRWTRHALAVAGFGYPSGHLPVEIANWSPTYAVVGSVSMQEEEPRLSDLNEEEGDKDPEMQVESEVVPGPAPLSEGKNRNKASRIPLYGVDKPFFHSDLADAVQVAVINVQRRIHRKPIELLSEPE